LKPLQPPGLLRLALEARAPLEFASSVAAAPLLATAKRGDGHPVIVYPGFLATDISTAPLRALLNWLGYETHGWSQGRNLSPTPDLFAKAIRRIQEVHELSGKKVSLVGWSLGGLYAREFAKKSPGMIRSVVTLGSPFVGARYATNASILFDLINKGRPQMNLAESNFHVPPPVPTTSIYSRTDGIVAWQCSINEVSPMAENIEVPASHTGLGVNPLVLLALADRLAQPENNWQPFARTGLRRIAYPNPLRPSKAG
jgi:pimeloyl-ACP methyl ester carboxylesterase